MHALVFGVQRRCGRRRAQWGIGQFDQCSPPPFAPSNALGLAQIGDRATERSASRTAWILGFISAFNQYGLQSQGADVSEGKNTDELMGWIDNYCRQHQGDDLHTASEAFIDDFRQRNRR
jgi:hypothetical protein